MDTQHNINQPSSEAAQQPTMEFLTSTAAMVFLKSLYDIGKDSGVLFNSTKPFCQVINSEFIDGQHVVELMLNNSRNHSIKILGFFAKGTRALTDNLKLELREREQYFSNGYIDSKMYYEPQDSWVNRKEESNPKYAAYPFLIRSNFSYRLRVSLPLQPKPDDDNNLGITFIGKVADLDKLSHRDEKIKVRLFCPE